MFIEHLNLVVRNLDNSLRFYRAAFPDWKIRGGGESDWYGKSRNWLHFGDERQYLALADNGDGEGRDLTGHSPGMAHFAFAVTNITQMRERLESAGFLPSNLGSFAEADVEVSELHRKNIYFKDPDGFEVEFVQYTTDIMAERNQYD